MSRFGKPGRGSTSPSSTAAGWRLPRGMTVVLAMIIMAAIGFGWIKGWQAYTPQVLAPQITIRPAPDARPGDGFEQLTGRWLRPDGGYIIEVRRVEPGGKLIAAYFNPRPIHVVQSEASRDGETVNIFVELQDVNYPGSSYRLTYDPVRDCLKGSCFQAAIKQTFAVYFVRLRS